MTLNSGLEVTQGHWKLYRSKAWGIRFHIRIPFPYELAESLAISPQHDQSKM